MRVINLAVIANNYGQTYDGVGAFAAVISSNFSSKIHTEIYTGYCNEKDSKWKRFTTIGMTRAILNCRKDILKFDAVLLEYPFVEWNPLILLAYSLLTRSLHVNDKKMFLSLHEYSRVNKIRKLVIRRLLTRADCVFVSSEGLKEDISAFAKNISVRNIPTNIYSDCIVHNKRNKRQFVYFGLVNKTKAFEEMLEAWDTFNEKEENVLFILTGSKLDDMEKKHKRVKYVYMADDATVLHIMQSSICGIIPVKPEVDMKNATFKTAALSGCACIGRFCEEYKELPFVIHLDDYGINSFVKAFHHICALSDEKIQEIAIEAEQFGKRYTPGAVSWVVEKTIMSLLGGNVDEYRS